jgi:murein DD-endopeptidase MepM/ murein hydrolase activator NlpD
MAPAVLWADLGGGFLMSASSKSLANSFDLSVAPMARWRVWLDAVFPDRQILIRGPGNVSAVRLSQRAQLLAATGACVVLLALGVSGFGLVVACRAEAHAAQTAARLQSALTRAQGEAARAEAQYAQAAQARDQTAARAEETRDIAVAQAIQARDLALTQAVRARDAAIAKADKLATGNSAALDGLIQQTQTTLGAVQAVIKSTGLNPDRLADASASPPLPPAIPPASLVVPSGLPGNSAARAGLLVAELARLRALGNVLAQLPLSSPTARAIVSSGFGMRADPFTGAPEFHVGIDLPGPIGAPVYATAPGIVTFAGPSTGYGILITIDHGFGLSTRYSHLDKILVKEGSVVALHQEIGLMGNTGWSTGPHLLYETRVDGQPQNPLHFIKVNPYDVQN